MLMYHFSFDVLLAFHIQLGISMLAFMLLCGVHADCCWEIRSSPTGYTVLQRYSIKLPL